MSRKKDTLLFVYNAESGFFNKASDFAHKIISPSTYECSLCTLTYGSFSMENKWASFIEGLDYKVQFSYKNKVELNQFSKLSFPVLLYKSQNNSYRLLLSAEQINKQKTLDGLIELVEKELLVIKESK